MGCGPINRIIFTDKSIRNKKERDKFESSDAQKIFSDKLKELGVFVNTNGLYHFSMSHTTKIVEELIGLIKRAS